MATEERRDADDFMHAAPYADSPSKPDDFTVMPFPSTPSPPRRAALKTTPRHHRAAGRVAATALAAAIALVLGGCSTPVLKPELQLPAQFAAQAAADIEPEVAWWESYNDPLLSDLIQRAARENRDVKIAAERLRAARAGETVSRSWLFPSVGVSAGGRDRNTR
jgi:hypothetical protein